MTPKQFEARLAKDIARYQKNIEEGMFEAAQRSVPKVVKNTPKAFGELRNSVHATQGPVTITVSAPHAAAVEIGSRPHVVPIEELVKWVKLRGMQGLSSQGRVIRSAKSIGASKVGPTTAGHAMTVAAEIRSLRKDRATPIDAPLQIAKRIQAAIAAKGTEPHWYVSKTLPDIEKDLNGVLSRVQW